MYRRASAVLVAFLAAGFCSALVAQVGSPASASDSLVSTGTETVSPPPTTTESAAVKDPINWKLVHHLKHKIQHHRHAAHYWEKLSLMHRSAKGHKLQGTTSVIRLRQMQHRWRRLHWRAWRHAHPVPYRSSWLCIHSYEGSWTDPNAPYYGGLQMDLTFQRSYGPWLLRKKGTADHWKPIEQMWVAERARRSGRGFYPWPLTARYCGLI